MYRVSEVVFGMMVPKYEVQHGNDADFWKDVIEKRGGTASITTI